MRRASSTWACQPWESNAPHNTFSKTSTPRYSSDTHSMLNAVWSIPLGKDTGFSFKGIANFIASKGKSASGADMTAEINIDMQFMYDLSGLFGAKPKSLKFGLE